MAEQVILVDHNDNPIGTMEKMETHRQGLLHRAFSIFIFNSKGELLLQQRALDKYHSAGKWTNTCCSHPRPAEQTEEAAHRRLKEEIGLQCELRYGFNFVYKASFTNDLIEYEYDHVFWGVSDILPLPDAKEVASFKYMNLATLATDLINNPDLYTVWFKICFNQIEAFKPSALEIHG